MLQTIKHQLDKKCIILASSSPRRSEILRTAGLTVEIYPAGIEENLPKCSFAEFHQYPVATASLKTRHVLKELLDMEKPVDIVIGADTIVVYDKHILEKPKDREDAFRMLSMLNGNTHEVITGVCMAWKNEEGNYSFDEFHETTQVHMSNVAPDVWLAYIDTGEPMDKAGAYGIQGLGGSLVKGITGDYFNVVGLPLCKLTYHLYRLVKDQRFAAEDESGSDVETPLSVASADEG